jgi:hypothetical protein
MLSHLSSGLCTATKYRNIATAPRVVEQYEHFCHDWRWVFARLSQKKDYSQISFFEEELISDLQRGSNW